MSENQIKPEKITKPIQLLGAWLVGLFSINSCYLVGAANFDVNSWQSEALVLAAIINVPIFLGSVFLLQTKFRPELQEDSYYSSYLNKKTNESIKVPKNEIHLNELTISIEKIEEKLTKLNVANVQNKDAPEASLLIGINKHLDDRSSIKEVLSENGVVRVTSFGSKDVPDKRVMSISQYLDNKEIDIAINLAKQLNLDGYNFFDSRGEETREDILIGSYGNSEYELISKSA